MAASSSSKRERSWLYDLLLIVVLLTGLYLRTVGLNWDQNQHLHPDERFLTMVETALQPIDSPKELLGSPPENCTEWGGYFDTACSPLNPHNRGHGFFVYGTLPIFTVRYVAEAMTSVSQWAGQMLANVGPDTFVGGLLAQIAKTPNWAGYDQVNLVGRQLSALADLLTIVVLYFIAARLYGRKVGLLAAAFSSLAVLQIQQSHFFTVDTFANFFMYLAIYFAVVIAVGGQSLVESRESETAGEKFLRFVNDPLFWRSVGFGLSLGMAVASKLNAAPLAILLPGAFALRLSVNNDRPSPTADDRSPNTDYWTRVTVFIIVGALASLLAFRIFQPYTFSGPGFFGLKPNQAWINNIIEQRAQAGGDVDVPFALQWARRSHLYSFENLTTWGLGLPLGILAWAGFLWMGWRILKGERRHALLWGWTALYFLWQSVQFNPTMRYQLPIYPLLAMMAAYFVFRVSGSRLKVGSGKKPLTFDLKPLAVLTGGLVLIATALWALAFIQIYKRPHTRVAATRWIYQNVPGAISLRIQGADGTTIQQPLPFPVGFVISADTPYTTQFASRTSGALTEIYLPHVADTSGESAPQTLNLFISLQPEASPNGVLGSAYANADFGPRSDPHGDGYRLKLDPPATLVKDQIYFLRMETTGGALTLAGAAPINETSWDDGLPLRLEGYDGFGGIYQTGLNFEMYWDDNADKLTRFTTTLDQGEYIFISSNRQWATTTRVPERYPLTTAYYRALIGCPPEMNVITCYNVAKPGDFQGQLGYELAAVFESYPTLEIPGMGTWQVNDQFAEEAFTVYDHPKVLIFQKRADYDPAQVQAILGAVDLSHVVHLTPRRAGSYKDLMLPADRLAAQQAGGTWSELFDTDALYNRYPVVGLVLWYLFVFVLGVFMYPIVRLAFPGLADKGYPLSRALGLVLLAYFPWLLGSLGIPYSRVTIGIVFGAIVLIGAVLAWRQRDELRAEFKSKKKYFLTVEFLFFAFFLFDLLIRIGNPDLWHPSKGGERPMDFSYFNAVLKSTTFPPYDPWFAGGYINYYYYGFVLVGTPVKLLGIVPSVAYNFILPTLFAMVGMGAFSIGWNLVAGSRFKVEDDAADLPTFNPKLVAGLAASAGMVLLGNLGMVRAVYQGLQRIVDPVAHTTQASIFKHMWWAMQGFAKMLNGAVLPLGRGDWYWFPSRVIPAPGDVEPITEFPLFTFLYSDLHAHMIVLPLALLAIAWALSFLLARRDGKWSPMQIGFELAIGGLIIGALRPTNTWDMYAYLPLAGLVVGYALWRYADKDDGWRVVLALVGIAALAFLSMFFYEPYTQWFGQAYGKISRWTGTHTPIWSYFTHWGLFLFVIVSWMWWETHEWMANTPVSALNKLKPHRLLIEALAAIFLAALLALAFLKVQIGWLALPLAVWAGILVLRPDLPDGKRLVLFMVGTGLLLTIAVEVIVLVGDIGRMNTVFKLYLQTWTLFAVSAGASLGWLLPEIPKWRPNWRTGWQAVGVVLLVGAGLFTLLGTLDKVRDRVAPDAPHSLDSMAYMEYARYWDAEEMDLSQDYNAIRWMQENVQGSPVIVEANTPEYRWGSRYTIYTGLPGVVGWNWHQRQQRALVSPDLITGRIDEIKEFYTTSDPAAAKAFLEKYNVRYIVVGQLERIYYPGAGLTKFESLDGTLWQEVFRDGETAIYEVLR
ncbi:MAG: hypothetical protein GXP40_01315 [Chloroflexi bacterium]|nr:hypothetical protein [Chloroflexota bacterium]